MNHSLKIVNAKCHYKNMVDWRFDFGNVYFLHCQENSSVNAFIKLILGLSTATCQGQILLNDQPISEKVQKKLGCYIGENEYNWYGSPLSVKSRLLKSLSSTNKYGLNTLEKYIQRFNLIPERLNRSLDKYSNERYQASLAIGSSQGKEIFCFPWLYPDIIDREWGKLKSILDFITEYGALVIVPVDINYIRTLKDNYFNRVKIVGLNREFNNESHSEGIHLNLAQREVSRLKSYNHPNFLFEDNLRYLKFFYPYYWTLDITKRDDRIEYIEFVTGYSFIKVNVYIGYSNETPNLTEMRLWIYGKLGFYLHEGMEIDEEKLEEFDIDGVKAIKRYFRVQDTLNYQVGFVRKNDMVVFHLHYHQTMGEFCLREFEELLRSFQPKI